jgi:hypothetical protein
MIDYMRTILEMWHDAFEVDVVQVDALEVTL